RRSPRRIRPLATTVAVEDAERALCGRHHRSRRPAQRYDHELGDADLVRPEMDRHQRGEQCVHARTHRGERRVALNLVDREDRAIVRKFTKPVEVDLAAKTLNGFPYVEKLTGAPVLSQAVAYLDCEVRERLEAGDHTFFVGEIVDCAFLKDEGTEVLRMEDTRMNYGG